MLRRIPALLLLAPIGLVASVGAGAAARPQPTSAWVLSVQPGFSEDRLPGSVQVTGRMPAVHALAVRLPAGAVQAALRTPGVRAARPDVALRPTGATEAGAGVFAPEAVGGLAGDRSAGQGVRVAVVDTGVEETAALDLSSGRLVRGPDFSGGAGAARDGFGHGTFLANLVAGGSVRGDRVGVAPGAVVVDVKVADGNGDTSLSKVLQGLNWVAGTGVRSGVRVVCLALAADRPSSGYGPDPLTDAADAVQQAGATVVVSVGNDPGQVGDPAQDPALLAVGAADTTGAGPVVASFSGRGTVAGAERPDVVGPGVRLLSLLPARSVLATTYPQAAVGRLYRGSGTSQATAVVAGEVAMFLSGRGSVDPQDVRESFARAATPLGAGSGHGLAVVPTAVSHGTGGQPGTAPSSTDPSASSSSWSSSSWSSSSWSSSSWSSSSWSSSSWSSSSWSSSSWSSSSWSASRWG